MPIPDNPQTRQEMYLNAMATGDSSGIPESPQTREEMYLDAIVKNGSGGGGGGSGGGALLVTLTMQPNNPNAKGDVKASDSDTYTVTANKTAGEIYNALKGGVCVIYTFTDTVNDEGYVGPVSWMMASEAVGYYTINIPSPYLSLGASTANDYPYDDRYMP